MSYKSSERNWKSDWAPYRDLLGWVVGLTIMDGPGLFWLYIFVDALRQAPSTEFWFGPTPTGETSIFAQHIGAITLFVIWTGLVLALFSRPLGETLGEIRS